jgi:hypothetical protein
MLDRILCQVNEVFNFDTTVRNLTSLAEAPSSGLTILKQESRSNFQYCTLGRHNLFAFESESMRRIHNDTIGPFKHFLDRIGLCVNGHSSVFGSSEICPAVPHLYGQLGFIPSHHLITESSQSPCLGTMATLARKRSSWRPGRSNWGAG